MRARWSLDRRYPCSGVEWIPPVKIPSTEIRALLRPLIRLEILVLIWGRKFDWAAARPVESDIYVVVFCAL